MPPRSANLTRIMPRMPTLPRARRSSVVAAIVWAAVLSWSQSASAALIIYDFVQTSASVPGLQLGAQLIVNGTLADLPTVSYSPCPVGGSIGGPGNPGPFPPRTNACPPSAELFGNLVSLTLLTAGIPRVLTLADFLNVMIDFNRPQWSISPTGIEFVSIFSDFHMGLSLVTASISYNTDFPSVPNDACHFTGACRVSGFFTETQVPVPEPATVTLLGLGLAGLAALRRRHQATSPSSSPASRISSGCSRRIGPCGGRVNGPHFGQS
jgi:hypothetical protein